jgi:DNA (cytosine-5)-methyltransferase 1
VIVRGIRGGDPTRVMDNLAPSHRAEIDEKIRARRPGETIVGSVNFRMRGGQQRAEVRFDLANALRTASGGSSIQTLLIIDDAGLHARKITPREAARLMGLPDSYVLPANVGDGHTLVGDAVVAPVVRFLAENLLEPLLASAERKAAAA